MIIQQLITHRTAETNVDLPSDYGRCSVLLKGEILQSEPWAEPGWDTGDINLMQTAEITSHLIYADICDHFVQRHGVKLLKS